ncbi:hypothetical protein [uncultured Agrobacterium sp.]|uniref:hypothetical protein n=1 Tax=uncultured Agrobacterium sp. TaxID=157277 RepID=UPI0025D539C9|nr:hypothetical protein [uncultured Agrobacterium sp.]
MMPKLVIGSFAGLMFATSAHALDGQRFLNVINSLTKPQGTIVSAGSVEVNGDDVHLKSVQLTFPALEHDSLEISDLTFEDVQPLAGGGYVIGRLSLPDFKLAEEDVGFSYEGVELQKCQISGNPKGVTLNEISFCEVMKTGAVSLIDKGRERLRFGSSHFTATRQPDDTGLGFDGSVDDLLVSFEDTSDALDEVGATWKAIGVPEGRGYFRTKGSWTLADGRLTLADNVLSIGDIGTLTLGFDVSGYTLKAIYALQDATAKAEQEYASQPEMKAHVLTAAMTDLSQQVSLHSARIRFEDDGITGRLIALAGQGKMDAPTTAKLMSISATQKLTELQPLLGKVLVDDLTAAVTAFLQKPQNFELSTQPKQPLKLQDIITTARNSPDMLPGLFLIKVTANE